VVLDEFQDITRVEGMDALLRSHIQFQGEVASFVFAGSEPGLMRELFDVRERPLYGQAVPMRLGRLADADIAAYVADRFRESGRSVGEAANPLAAAAKGHPQRAMLLAHRLWEEVPGGGAADLGAWNRAHVAALEELAAEFDAGWRHLSTNEQKAIRSLTATGGSPFQTRVLEGLGLAKSSARSALVALQASAIVERDGDRYALTDPLFEEWVAGLRGAGET
jgi:hypothetical protein